METILSIAGKPGLYKLLSRSKSTFVVETLDSNRRRMPVFPSDRVTSLSDVSMYTVNEDVPLWQVLKSMGEKENGGACKLNYKKAASAELRSYFAEVLPSFDRDRVHDSDIRKLIQWYDILVAAGIADFEALLKPEEDEAADSAEKV